MKEGFTNYLKNKYAKNEVIGCEIGISSGVHVLQLLNNLNVKKLYMIDPYCKYVDGDGKIKSRRLKYFKMKKDLFKYRKKVKLIKKTSDDAVKFIPSGLDFIYVDGNHSYKNIHDDLYNYYSKLKIHGVLGGDDYGTCFEGIKKAVDEFAEDKQLELVVSGREFLMEVK